MPLRLGEFLACFPGIRAHSLPVEDFSGDEGKFDSAVLLQVTEHLTQPEKTIASVCEKLRDGGRVFIAHHNFYCWTGHHCAPYTVDDYDPSDPSLAQVADWNHIHNRK
jgi:SAM-dependent methyltransferase